jgi:rare lipoprotein A
VPLLAACASSRIAEVETRSSKQTAPTPANQSVESKPAPPAPSPAQPVTDKKGGYYKDDGPGDNPPPDLASIPDAQPKAEPLHRFANRPYVALGQNYVPQQELTPFKETGIASWYGRRFHGVNTSSGERYDMYGMTAAHPTLPIPSYARVTNVENGKSVVVRINDRGPFHSDRVIDLSYTAAWKLGYVSKGSTRVEVESLMPEGVTLLARNVPPIGSSAAVPDVAPNTNTTPTPAPSPVAETQSMPALVAPPVQLTADQSLAAPSLAANMPSGVYLQLGSFSSNRNAEGFRDYAKQELGSVKQQIFIVEDAERERYRLHLGPFTDAAAAREMAERIAGKLKLKPFLVQR